MKTTPWFPAHVKPVRKGVYEWDLADGYRLDWFRYWNGQNWMLGDVTPADARQSSKAIVYISHKERWRGLASKGGK